MPTSSESLVVRIAPPLFVFLWSTGFIGAKYGLPYAEPMTYLTWRMALVSAIFVAVIAIVRPRRLSAAETAHSMVAGTLVHGLYLGGVFSAISLGVPAGISALIAGLQPLLTATLASRFLGERVTALQWIGLVAGLVGVMLVLHDRDVTEGAALAGWIATVISLLGITLGSLYQKRFCTTIDWRAGNLVQFVTCTVLFGAAAFAFETRVVQWTFEFVFALGWMVVVMSGGAIALMYWLIRRAPATQVASLFYLVPTVTALLAYLVFDERLSPLALVGMAICAVAVFLVNVRPGRW
ncbi:MAG: putative amino-acid metabolite efflux pump [Pseudorhodoplanes sp.]|nr:putative amino-acid metabolite efflux pump [Pseudorhodoplanes sp.]GIK82293.1 MAG: peptide ABC transporter ATP-binding protein [Alphaproteobacteria bacterium]